MRSEGAITPAVRASVTQLPPLIRDLLRKRGIATPEEIAAFVSPDYDAGLADPFLLTDMELAVQRIMAAAKAGERVAVYGDYDIDGVSATTLMLETLRLQGLEPQTYIPDRYKEGYGLHRAALEQLHQQKVTLVVAVDCGITNVAEVAWASQHGIDVIVVDHHSVPPEIPAALAVVNPKRDGDRYPFKELAGVGVVFAVTRALQQQTGIPAVGQEKWLLDLVALGTVGDVMPLVGENRIMVKFGLLVLRKTRRVGLVALAQSAGVELAELRAYHLGFVFGPRLNAAGRLEHANYSLELIITKDPLEAQALAFQLEEMNHQRQLQQERILQEADALAADYGDDPVLVLADADWPHGIVGIAASKLAEKWRKPTLLLQLLDGVAKGSGRSVPGYSLIDGLRSRADLFHRLGGHQFAAGFTLPAENLAELREMLSDHFRQSQPEMPAEPPQPVADLELADPDELTWELYEGLQLLEPYGNANPEPVIGIPKLKVIEVSGVGKSKQHLRLKLTGDSGAILSAIGFNLTEKYPNLRVGQTTGVLGYLKKNHFNGQDSLQLVLLGLQ